MIKEIRLNNDWYYKDTFNENMLVKGSNGFEKVNLPHANKEIPYNYFDEKDYQFVSCYKKTFEITLNDNEHLMIRFEGVMAASTLYINGHEVTSHYGGYTPFEIEITKFLIDGENEITVKVDSRELENVPPFGGQIDYLTYGGIYREVSLLIYEDIYIKEARIETLDVLSDLKKVKIHMKLNNFIDEKLCKLSVEIANRNVTFDLDVKAGLNDYVIEVNDIIAELWSLDTPNLYSVELNLTSDSTFDLYRDRIGFRTADFRIDGFYLNEEKIQIVGLNRHQSFPYVGYAMPKRVQEKDAEILKNDLHLNLVRTSHYPQSKHFLNRCDELGLLVFEEIPGWQHIGDKDWQEIAIENVREMVRRDWNHPSIIIWGVRINESADSHDFYTSTNQVCRALDPSRQTGGVRCIDDSEFLEDVYTMNDFVLDGGQTALRNQMDVTGLENNVPYLVTEYNGHMYPTKRFDQEERQMEHVIRHLRVQNEAFKNQYISGAIGWCAFDYNTHNDFGSGDRICYHGIMDMFRIEKFAASVYKSQVSPNIEPVLEPITFWARGERSVGGILPLYILTNCDYVELRFGNKKTFKLFKSDLYGNLPYSPIVIDESIIPMSEIGEWGMKWEDGLIQGYVGDEMVIEKRLSKGPLPTKLEVSADDLELSSCEKDATRITIKIKDQMNQLLPFFDRPITISLSGPARLQGPDVVVLKGGAIACWIETLNQAGTVEVTFTCDGFKEKIKIEVK